MLLTCSRRGCPAASPLCTFHEPRRVTRGAVVGVRDRAAEAALADLRPAPRKSSLAQWPRSVRHSRSLFNRKSEWQSQALQSRDRLISSARKDPE